MKYAVLGAHGQLGSELCRRLSGQVVPLTRAEIDLGRIETVRPVLEKLRCDFVINCAAYNLVDQAESEAASAFAVNAWGVRELAFACREFGCILVHFSTDYVFGLDAERRAPYTEADAPGPLSVYGLSKLAGEYLVRSLCPKHFVIRTCGLYGSRGAGGKGRNFVTTMLRLANEGKPIRVVSDQICTPSSAADVAAATAGLLATEHFGVHHLTNSGSCSWYEFAHSIFASAGLQPNITPIRSDQYAAAARRPTYSVLASNRWPDLGLPPVRNWREALSAYMRENALLALHGHPLSS
jgi:dTDP-4-dehydrorhamnose reductase